VLLLVGRELVPDTTVFEDSPTVWFPAGLWPNGKRFSNGMFAFGLSVKLPVLKKKYHTAPASTKRSATIMRSFLFIIIA
jgi:hypothetical protein